MAFLLSEAGSRIGPSPGRHTHPARSPRLSRAGSARLRDLARAPYPPDREQQEVGVRLPAATPRCFAPTLVLSPAGPPGRAGRLFPLRCGHRLRRLHRLQETPPPLATGRHGRGRDREVKGRVVTSPEGAGLGSVQPARAFPSSPGAPWFPVWVWPRGTRMSLRAGVCSKWPGCAWFPADVNGPKH